MDDYVVYTHTFPNGKKYVGITCQGVNLRWRREGKGYTTQKRVFRAIQKYGWDNISSEIIYNGLSKHKAEIEEINLIKLYNTTNKLYGYNTANGGNSAGRNSAETRAKISAAKKGVKMSEEAKMNMSIAQTGRKQTDKTKKLLSEMRKGIHKSEETKIKISETIKSNDYEMQRWRDILKTQRKPIIQYDMNNKKVNKFASISIASHYTGICRNNINNCCLKRYGCKTAGGFKWEYDNE